jgi:hypothetical protein
LIAFNMTSSKVCFVHLLDILFYIIHYYPHIIHGSYAITTLHTCFITFHFSSQLNQVHPSAFIFHVQWIFGSSLERFSLMINFMGSFYELCTSSYHVSIYACDNSFCPLHWVHSSQKIYFHLNYRCEENLYSPRLETRFHNK